MEGLVPDLVALLCSYVSVRDIVRLSAVNKTLRRKINENSALWTHLCVKLLGKQAPETRKQLTATIGLAGGVLSWRDLFRRTWGSAVLTWGDASRGRTGHAQVDSTLDGDDETASDGFIRLPKVLRSLSGKGIDFIGKTAEMGSVAIAFGGRQVYVWGTFANSMEPLMLTSHELCGNDSDRIVDASCHHDSGFMLVFASGLTLVGKERERGPLTARGFFRFDELIFGEMLLAGERAVCSVGSQAGLAGVRTNRGRLIWWPTYPAMRYCMWRVNPKRKGGEYPQNSDSENSGSDASDGEIAFIDENAAAMMQAYTTRMGEANGDVEGERLAQEELERARDALWSSLADRRVARAREKAEEAARAQQLTAVNDPPVNEVDQIDQMLAGLGLDTPTEKPIEPFQECKVIEPLDENNRPLDVVKTAFGHRVWFALTSEGFLYEFHLNSIQFDTVVSCWTRVAGTEHLADDPIVRVDAGSAHHAFCTLSGKAYTWGVNSFGMLGLGREEDAEAEGNDFIWDAGWRASPCHVATLKGVVAVGAGGYVSWNGSFTLFLLDNNDLYVSGMLGDRSKHHSLPVKINCPDLVGRHILSISCGEDWAAIVGSSI